jgi:hypothetical protein
MPLLPYFFQEFLRNGPLAQRLEQWTHNPLVPGSNPGGPTNTPISMGKTAANTGG